MFHYFQEVKQFFNEREKYGVKPGLKRVEFLLDSVQHPEQEVKGIHVAGTNGKGSTLQFINDALAAHDYDVGMFTSPSFTGLTGHFLINGCAMEKSEMIRLLNDLLPAIRQLDAQQNEPTPFEILTVLAFMYFQDRTDLVLIETGMGGRYDTTNCFTPILSVITTITIDHMQFLGETIEEIAYHKAGIIKEKRPVVAGKINDAAMNIIEREAMSLSAPLYVVNNECAFQQRKLHISSKQVEVLLTELALEGDHQQENAATALMTLALLSEYDFRLDWKVVEKSIANTTLPGRFERIHENPTIILDSAHNLESINAFKQTLLHQSNDKPTHLLFAGFFDKQLIKMLEQLSSFFTTMTVTTFDHPRATPMNAWELNRGKIEFNLEENWRAVVDDMFDKKDEIFCITGSLHFIMIVRQYIHGKGISFYR